MEAKKEKQSMSSEELKEKEKQKKLDKLYNKSIFEMMFPELSQIPLPWLIVGIICILFSLFTCIL